MRKDVCERFDKLEKGVDKLKDSIGRPWFGGGNNLEMRATVRNCDGKPEMECSAYGGMPYPKSTEVLMKEVVGLLLDKFNLSVSVTEVNGKKRVYLTDRPASE